ncbi:MAG TPA: 50S ribosomal protein L30 [Acidimicrobiia bacterium]|nr:50S ribosomal protein L30 [Acidimicrobiia bacterium]
MAAKTLLVTLRRSLIGEKPKTRATVRGLGLRKMNQTVQHDDTEAIRGMLHKVKHLVDVVENKK